MPKTKRRIGGNPRSGDADSLLLSRFAQILQFFTTLLCNYCPVFSISSVGVLAVSVIYMLYTRHFQHSELACKKALLTISTQYNNHTRVLPHAYSIRVPLCSLWQRPALVPSIQTLITFDLPERLSATLRASTIARSNQPLCPVLVDGHVAHLQAL
jgi:hypothetical protein